MILDAGPLNSLWVADALPVLLTLDMPLVVVDAVYDEVTSDPSFPKDRAVKEFVDRNRPPFIVETTDIGQIEREKRRTGAKLKRNAGELAIADFMSADDGLRRYLKSSDPVVILFEDADVRVFNRPPHLHLLSTVGMLRGLERVGAIESAGAIIHEMTHPSKPDRRPSDRRAFTDLPDGTDEPAALGSVWAPGKPR